MENKTKKTQPDTIQRHRTMITRHTTIRNYSHDTNKVLVFYKRSIRRATCKSVTK